MSVSVVSATSGDDESEYSIFYQFYKPDGDELTWESSSLFNLSNEGEVLLKFVVNGVLLTLLVSFGAIGNFMSVIVLLQKEMRSPIGCFLAGLAMADLVIAFVAIPIISVPSILAFVGTCKIRDLVVASVSFSTLLPTIYAIGSTAYFASVFFTLAIAVERYTAICNPFKATSFTYQRARNISIGIMISAVVYNIPRWFEYEVVQVTDPITQELVGYRPVPTQFRKNPIYDKAYVWTATIILLMWVPTGVLSFYNVQIYREIRSAREERQKLSPTQKHQQSLSKTLLIILSLSLLCNVVVIIEAVFRMLLAKDQSSILEIECLRNFTFELNSSVNFLIYCFGAKKFRRAFWDLWANNRMCRLLCCGICARNADGTASKLDPLDSLSQRTSSFSVTLPPSSTAVIIHT